MTVCQLIKQIICCTILFFLFFTSYVVASNFEDIEGTGCYKYGDNETPLIAKEMASGIRANATVIPDKISPLVLLNQALWKLFNFKISVSFY